jgi:drug/metabolite transporter (DMT)-like permease
LGQNSTLRGVMLMVVAMGMLPLLDVCAKFLGQGGIPILQIVWARMFFGAVFTLPFAWQVAGARALWPDRPGFHAARAAFLVGSTACFFGAISFMPIADSLAIFFVQPLLITALSPLLLKEHVGPRRWAAVAIGFCGTLIIIRPGLQEFNPGMALAFASGTCMALYMLITRRLARDEDPLMTTFHTSLMGAAMMSLTLPFLWAAPDAGELGLLLLLAAIAVVGHFLIARAYTMAEASLLAPLAYTEMIMATLAGWWFFGEMPDGWTFVGVAILIVCAIYISVRERVKRVAVVRGFEQP